VLNKTKTVLLVEDNPGDARLIREMLATQEDANFRLEWVDRLADALERLDRGGVDVVLLDLGLPDSQGLDTFITASWHCPQVPFVVLTGLDDETVGVIAVRQGAQDYLLKGEVDGGLLLRSIRYAAERKRTMEALRVSKESYRLLVNQVPAVVFKGYEDWSMDFFDNKVEALTGYSKEDFDSRRLKWCGVILPEDLDSATGVLIDAVKTNRAYVLEHRIRRKDGEIRWVQCRGQIFLDAAGKIDYISGVTFDITDHKRIEEALQQAHDELEQRVAARTADLARAVDQLEQEVERRKQAENALQKAHDDLELKVAMRTAELAQANRQMQEEMEERRHAEAAVEAERRRLFSLLDSLPVFVYLKAPDYRIRFANRVFRETFGQPGDKRCYEAVFNLQEPCQNCRSFQVFENNRFQEWEWHWLAGHRTYQVFNYPFADIDGSPLLLTLGVDISPRIQAEEALKESAKNLRHLASQLLSAQEKERRRISRDLHDVLGQSLLCLKLQARAIGKEIEPESQKIKADYALLLSGLDGLIDKVRRLSRDLSPPILEDLGITSALKHLFNEARKHHEISGCTLDIEEIDGLFGQEDQVNIYRIFQEALTNIGKYARATKISGVVTRREDEVFCQVEDNGRGFDVHRALTVDATGRGMGLASMRERARMLGGELHLWSEEGKGTRISFSLPIAQILKKTILRN
jgi:PAS domain S-box-containing protein